MDIQTSSAVFWTCLKAVSIWLLSVLLAVPEAIFSQVVSMQVKHIEDVLASFVYSGDVAAIFVDILLMIDRCPVLFH